MQFGTSISRFHVSSATAELTWNAETRIVHIEKQQTPFAEEAGLVTRCVHTNMLTDCETGFYLVGRLRET